MSIKIKEVLKGLDNDFYSKIILSEQVKQADYLLLDFEYQTINRDLYSISFPIDENLKNGVVQLQNKNEIVENKAQLDNSDILQKCKIRKGDHLSCKHDDTRLNFPINVVDNKFTENQPVFYLLNSVQTSTCNECEGDGLVTCYDSVCGGNHIWECDKCIGSGKVTCSKCSGEGWNRCGGILTGCGGSGKVKKSVKLASGKYSEKIVNCSSCSGKGKVKCTNCGTTGKVTCGKCSGSKTITCNYCYSDRKRYGLVDCKSCDGKGEFGAFQYVISNIEKNKFKKVIPSGETLQLEINKIEDYFAQLSNKKHLFYQHNDVLINDYSDFELIQCEKLEQELDLDKNSFPKILEERLEYRNIKCIEFEYKHIISNEFHTAVIIDFEGVPKLHLYSNPEEIKTNLKSVAKSTSGFFSKMFKTKTFKIKSDRILEIKLMIYLAKSDGKIEEEEKIYLSELIQNLEDFTNNEKKELFQLMDSKSLPALTPKELKFSDTSTAKLAIEKLENMALVDGDFEQSEKDFINLIKSMIN